MATITPVGQEAIAKLVKAMRPKKPRAQTLIVALEPFGAKYGEKDVDAAVIIGSRALPELVQLLAPDRAAGVQAAAARAVAGLGVHRDVRSALVDAGAIPPLVLLLGSDHERVQHEAAAALGALGQSDATRAQMAEAGAIPALVPLLRSANEGVQREAAIALIWLAHTGTLHPPIAEADAIPALVSLLGSANEGVQRQAAVAFGWLGQTDALRAPIAEAGAIPALIPLLSSANEGVQREAAIALKLLCLTDTLRPPIADAGAIPALVPLLSSANEGVQREAAIALKLLCLTDTLRPPIADAGAIPALVQLLSSANEGVQRQAAIALKLLCLTDTLRPPIADAGAIPALVPLLSSANEDVQRQAAVALSWLGQTDALRTQIAEAGAIPALIPLLRSANEDLQCQVAAALGCLGVADSLRAPIADAGAIPAFVPLLSSANEDMQYQAAVALYWLAHTGTLCPPIADAGAIPALVALLRSANVDVVRSAANVIRLCTKATQQCRASLIADGGCDALVPLLHVRDGSAASREIAAHAAVTLLSLVTYCTAQRAAIACTPGLVSALLGLVHSCATVEGDADGGARAREARQHALDALEILLCGSVDVRRRALASAGETHVRLSDCDAELRGAHARLRSLGDAVGAPSRQHDVVLRCADGTELGASRLLLAEHSQYYARQLHGSLSEGSQREVDADPDFSSAAHEALLRQLHSAGVAPLPTEPSVLLELLRLASKLQPPPAAASAGTRAFAEGDVLLGVVQRCEDVLLAGLDVDNCLDLLRHAKAAGGCARVVEGVRKLAKEQIAVIVKQEQWSVFKRDDPAEAFELMEALAVDMATQLSSAKRQRVQ